jgi:DNA mismatch repair protein MutH
MIAPPSSETELLDRAEGLAGLTLSDLARDAGLTVPGSPRQGKGFAGRVLEILLGASAGSLSEPDFQAIGVELKTVPVGADGRPLESTYVCTVPLGGDAGPLEWERSWVRRKLSRVLWIPVEGRREGPLGARRVGFPILWSPTPEEDSTLRADWEELMELVCLGQADSIDARLGTWLQIRPKAAHARARRPGVGAGGEPAPVPPRGFYLRNAFTARILARHYALPGTDR